MKGVCGINQSDHIQERLLCAKNYLVSRSHESLEEYSLAHKNADIKTSLRGFGAQTLVIVFITEI